MRIGIDIGGTNTDAVLVDENGTILFYAKTATTREIDNGFEAAIAEILHKTGKHPSEIQAAFLGTTHATNAILEKKDLFRVGVIRLAGHHPQSIPSCYAWPKELRESIYVDTITINGGFECHGEPISPLSLSKLQEATEQLIQKGAESIAVVGIFSPINNDQEIKVKEHLKKIAPDLPISLSHQIGGIGFLERENSTILNASLKMVMKTGFKRLQKSMERLKIDCPLWVTQNNGSVIDLEHAIEYPVLTISAGPTNSFIGGAKLAKVQNAIVVDIGGTSTDVGMVQKSYPRRSLNRSQIGGISLNFPMPDVLSIALGGGSHISINPQIQIGPNSSACRIKEESISFGGSKLTLTDIALSMGHLTISGANPKNVLCKPAESESVLKESLQRIRTLIDKMMLGDKNLPVILIGGGAALLPKEQLPEHFFIPEYAHVANAYGAALAEISGTIDTVVSLENRQEILDALQAEAIKKAIINGADKNKTKIINMEVIPYHYVPNKMARVIVSASGAANNR